MYRVLEELNSLEEKTTKSLVLQKGHDHRQILPEHSYKTMIRSFAGNVAAGLPRQVTIAGAQGMVQAGVRRQPLDDNASSSSINNKASHSQPLTTTSMIDTVLTKALREAHLTVHDLDGLIAVPSLWDNHFMEAHFQATQLNLFRYRPQLRCKTIDTGGAGPITAILEGARMILHEGLECVAVIAADRVGSMDSQEFLQRASHSFATLDPSIPSPAIPHGYDKLTRYQMEHKGLTRDQLRMAVCLESVHAGLHPESLYRSKALKKRQEQKETKDEPPEGSSSPITPSSTLLYTPLEQVQEAPSVTPNISILECARRADGAAAIILTSNRFWARRHHGHTAAAATNNNNRPTSTAPARPITLIGGGESSGPLYPLGERQVDESYFSCEHATQLAYANAGNLTAADIDFFGLYDCFPICLVRALEAAGLCDNGGEYLERQYARLQQALQTNTLNQLLQDPSFFPINTHGGLLCFGAPWEAPAMYNLIEAVHQLRGEAKGRQIPNCRRALVYGNGGVLSASAVAILAK